MDLNAVNDEWIAGVLASEEIDTTKVVEIFNGLVEADQASDAERWVDHLLEKLTDEKRYDEALPFLQFKAEVLGSVKDIKKALKNFFSADRKAKKLIAPSGFGESIPIAECFRRLLYLRRLREGMICYNSTWGVGTIERIDYFYQQLEIVFENKGEHEMAFGYASEALEVLDEEHLLYIKVKDPERMKEMLKKEPAEVVRKALRCYGSMPITRLQELLSPAIVSESGWKKFWDAARKELKTDASVEIPKKRSESIQIFESERAYDDSWFVANVVKENDIEMLFDRFKEIQEKEIPFTSEVAQEVLANRLAFIINGAPSLHPEWKAEGMIYARLFGIQPEGLDVLKLIRDLIDGDLVGTFDRLPGRQLQMLLSIILEIDKEAVTARLIDVLPKVSHPVLNEIISSLFDHDGEDAVKQVMAVAVGKRRASAPMLLWCQRSTQWIEKWNLISKGDLAFRIQEGLEAQCGGAMLRAQNQLRERFSSEEWLHDVMDSMTEQQRRDFLRRTNEGIGWDALDRKSVVAKILRKYSELQDVILSGKGSALRREVPHTSMRSYEAKQKHLEKIMTVEIPENSKEIELARSYGDLRENAEFKYAKERQGLLMAQGAQLAEDLEKVKPSDFSDVALDEVASGTGVELVYADGSTEVYYILGVWDQDEKLAIISSDTRLAQALIGHEAGDEVEIPSGVCTLKSILPLSDEIKAWIDGK